MANPKKSVWTPIEYQVKIGDNDYIIGPQPVERIIEFDHVMKQVGEALTNLSTVYEVVDKESQEVMAGPFEDEDEAKAQVTDDTEIKVTNPTFRDIVNALVSAPYPALKCVIPDLREEDVRQASFPLLKHILDLVIEVNGVEWFETFLKNSIGPLLPEIFKLVTDAIKSVIVRTTSPEAKMAELQPNGEKP